MHRYSVSNFSNPRALSWNQYQCAEMILSRCSIDSPSSIPDSFLIPAILYEIAFLLLCIFDVSPMESITERTDSELSFSVLVPRSVLREQYEGEIEPDELELMHEFEEGFDRVDFRTEFSPSPNLEGPQPQPRDNVSRNLPTASSSPPRARTNNDGEYRLAVRFLLLYCYTWRKMHDVVTRMHCNCM